MHPEIVKNKAIQANLEEFEKCSWNVAGYLLKIKGGANLFGDDNPAVAHSGEVQDALEELQSVVSHYEMDENYAAQNEKEAGDIMTIITVISVVMQLLNKLKIFRKNRNTPDGPRIDLEVKE